MTVAPPRTGRLVGALAIALIGGGLVVLTPTAASAATCPALRPGVTVDAGDRGEAVRAVQCALDVGLGDEFADLSVDGVFGPMTRSAVVTFQERSALTVDGIVGPRTYRALAEVDPRPDGDLPDVAAGPTVRRGDTGLHVRSVQAALGITADGISGPLTERAARAFQAREGLVLDGIVGPKTRRALAEHGVDGC